MTIMMMMIMMMMILTMIQPGEDGTFVPIEGPSPCIQEVVS